MRILILTTVAIATLVAFSCSNERGGMLAKLLRGGASEIPVTVESVVSREKPQQISIPALIEIADEITVSAPEAMTVDRVQVNEGSLVNVGDVIISVSEDAIQSRLIRMRIDLREAMSELEKDSYLLRNRDRLLDEERIDQLKYDNLENDVEASEARVDKIRLEISTLESQLGDLSLKSPAKGVIKAVLVQTGSTVEADAPLLKIANFDPAEVVFRLTSEQASLVRIGMPVSIRIPALKDLVVTGTVSFVDTKLDPNDQKFAIKAQVPNPDGYLKNSMEAHVEFRGPHSQRVHLIPEQALMREPAGFFVYTVIKGRAHKVQVIPQQTMGNYIEITRGLHDEDLVVVKGQGKLVEGTAVDIWGNKR